ncbi:MAG: hypothetical protein U5M51_06610 [Emticicia sp.]|nr:hypothetical protein [Emticicia sp.]
MLLHLLKAELKAALPNLLVKAPNGRFDQGVANAILAKLYINSQAWTGTAKNAEAIAAADADHQRRKVFIGW